nr:DUF115 domain-containing protein [Desulfobacula sp.]
MAESDKIYFEKNMALAKKKHPEIFRIMSEYNYFSEKAELVFAKNNKPNLKAKTIEGEWVFIHDPENPGIESEVFLSLVQEQSTGVVLMLGMGLGYPVLELLRKRTKLQYIIIFELNIEFFSQAIRNIDLSELFMDKRVMIGLGEPETLSSFMAPANRSLMLENIHTLNLLPCFKINPAYEKLSSRVFDYINAFNTEGATKTVHGRTFVENRLKHLTSMHHDKKLEDLSGRFKGLPALIIAAGPSLDKNIELVAKATGKAVIISVDTALPNLLNHGIRPDFVTSIDYNELTYEKISGSASNPACRRVNLICTSWVAHKVAKQFPANIIFWAFNNNPLENWINILLGGRMSIAGAGTVAHLNYISAITMGCDPIIFVGQDLAFSERKGHSSNVVLSSNEITKKTLDSGQDIMWVKGVSEPKVATNRQMHGYRRVFEKLIEGSGVKVINSTEGGAWIEGAEHIPLAQAIDRFCRSTISLDINHQSGQENPLSSMILMVKEAEKLEKTILKADKLARSIKQMLIRQKKGILNKSSFSDLPANLKKKISDLDACHKKADASNLWPLFDEMTMDGLRRNEREKQDIEKLEGIPGRYLEWLTKTVNRIDNVNKIRTDNLCRFIKQLNELILYYQNEKYYLERIKDAKMDLENIHGLLKLYYNSGNFVLLEKMMDKYGSAIADSADILYYQGLIALLQEDYGVSENKFLSAGKIDKAYIWRIDQKRQEIADHYRQLAMSEITLAGFGHTVVELLLLKGLKCYPLHTEIRERLNELAEADLRKATMNPALDGNLLRKWTDLVYSDKEVKDGFKKNTINSLYLSLGKLLVDAKKYQDALVVYQKALSIIPDIPDIHIALADIYFALEEFDSGIRHLRKAVSLDKQYAVYWNNMGKNLQSQKDYSGAILAFEQYFIALPENISALKDIGDCHTKLGNIEAAREAYQQFKTQEAKKSGI